MELKSKYEQALAKYNCNVDEAAAATAASSTLQLYLANACSYLLFNSIIPVF